MTRLTLPTTRTFVLVFAGSAAGLIVMFVVGNALEAAYGRLESRPWLRGGYLAIFFALLLAMVYTIWPLMVRSIIGFQAAFWGRVATATRSRKTADTVARAMPVARRIGDILIVAGWAMMTLGLAIAVPAMLRDVPL